MAYQALYRRYRSQTFGDLRGQPHVHATLTSAVAAGRTSHAYLFSGPRGTGKTSTARILAKALNCSTVVEGEPCNACPSCADITEGRSLDVFELDAASHNGVEAMRDLVARAALGTPGRWKVYIVDEAHMLSAAASNALLKTLEEPPAHVVFVLATTEARKVLPTIRSRTQHLEFRLLSTQALADHLRWVAGDAGLDLPSELIDLVAKRGNGSVRDALSALDQVAAAGGFHDDEPSFEELVEALCERDLDRAMAAVAERFTIGYDPRQLTTDLVEHLRNAFLATISRSLVSLSDEELARVESQARRLGRATTVRAMELLGQSLIDMREAPDPRVIVELALIRLCRPETDPSPAALLERIERLERLARTDDAPAAPGPAGPAGPTPTTDRFPTAPGPPKPASVPSAVMREPGSPAAAARAALRSRRSNPPAAPAPPTPHVPIAPIRSEPVLAPSTSGPTPSRDEVTMAWADVIMEGLSVKTRARFRIGRFVNLDGDQGKGDRPSATSNRIGFVLPNAIHRDRCEEVRAEVETALGAHFATPMTIALVVESDLATSASTPAASGRSARRAGPPRNESPAPPAPPPPADIDDEEAIDLDDLTDAPPATVTSPIDQLRAAFGGATVVDPDS